MDPMVTFTGLFCGGSCCLWGARLTSQTSQLFLHLPDAEEEIGEKQSKYEKKNGTCPETIEKSGND